MHKILGSAHSGGQVVSLRPKVGNVSVTANEKTVTISWTEFPHMLFQQGTPQRKSVTLPRAVWDALPD